MLLIGCLIALCMGVGLGKSSDEHLSSTDDYIQHWCDSCQKWHPGTVCPVSNQKSHPIWREQVKDRE